MMEFTIRALRLTADGYILFFVWNCFFMERTRAFFSFCQSAMRKPQNKSQANKLLVSSVCGW